MATTAPDPQKPLIYAWEDGFRSFDERTMTRAQVRRLVSRICRKWRVPLPRIRFLPKGYREWSYIEGNLLAMNYSQCNEAIVAHEMAHYVVDHSYPEGTFEIHGPEFVALYIEMLVYAQVAPRVAIVASLIDKGIEWTSETT